MSDEGSGIAAVDSANACCSASSAERGEGKDVNLNELDEILE